MINSEIYLQRTKILFCFFLLILMLGISPYAIALEEGKACINRQTENKFKGAVVHDPVSKGQCMKCHTPHASSKSKGLKTDMPALCLDCHDKPMKDDKSRDLPSLKAVFEDTKMTLHKPFADGDCLCCHDPHASSHYRLLNDDHNRSFYTRFSKEKYMCFGCHSEKAFSEPRTLTETKFRNGNLNLHYRHVNRKKGRSCRVCHHHHGSKNAALIRERLPFGEHNINITEFKKTESGGKCSPSCHSTVQYDRLEPFRSPIKVTEHEGEDATYEELLRAVTPLAEEPVE